MRKWRRLAVSAVLAILLTTVAAVAAAAQVPEAEIVATEWLGPRPSAAPELTIPRPVWQGPGALVVEQQLAARTIRSRWPQPLADARAGAILDGFAWYLQGRVIERVFDQRYLRPGHSVEARRYLGDHIIWSFPPLRVSRSAVVNRDRYAAVFTALERWIGVPNLQGAMFEVARLPSDRLTADTIVKTISDAAGQDLSWAFDAAEPGVEMNYAVTALSSADVAGCAAPCVETTVDVSREGDGVFPGRTARRAGAFDAGDALVIKVVFADGTVSSERWDGRDRARTFRFRGPSRATAAYLDPDRLVTLDRNRLDNARVTPAPTNVPVGKWAARWLVWLQHTMLSYGFLA